MENFKLLCKIAWSFHKTTGIEWEDLVQEAAYAYLMGIKKYDPERGKISTHIWKVVSNHLRNFLKEEWKQTGHLDYYDALEWTNIEVNHPTFMEAMTEDARQIAKIVLSTPKKFAPLNINDAELRVIRIMAKNGWDIPRIVKAILNLEDVCSSE